MCHGQLMLGQSSCVAPLDDHISKYKSLQSILWLHIYCYEFSPPPEDGPFYCSLPYFHYGFVTIFELTCTTCCFSCICQAFARQHIKVTGKCILRKTKVVQSKSKYLVCSVSYIIYLHRWQVNWEQQCWVWRWWSYEVHIFSNGSFILHRFNQGTLLGQ